MDIGKDVAVHSYRLAVTQQKSSIIQRKMILLGNPEDSTSTSDSLSPTETQTILSNPGNLT